MSNNTGKDPLIQVRTFFFFFMKETSCKATEEGPFSQNQPPSRRLSLVLIWLAHDKNRAVFYFAWDKIKIRLR